MYSKNSKNIKHQDKVKEIIREHKQLKGVYLFKHYILTKNLTPGYRVYDEKLFNFDGVEYREWKPEKSKLCAAIKNGISQIAIKPGSIVLYLGASSGTTVSHVSDIIGSKGFVFALDFSIQMARDLYYVVKSRPNMAIIVKDANYPHTYLDLIGSSMQIDVIYQDIAQKNQVDIFLANIRTFLKKKGFALLAVKSRSIDVTKKPTLIFKQVKKQLEDNGLVIVDYRTLEPYEKDHILYVCKLK